MRLLIIGGYGTFGSRIATCLSDEPRLHIVIAGRSLDKAKALCDALSGGAATYSALRLDRGQSLTDQIDIQPDLIIDASGPFQAYAEKHVVSYALSAPCHYADISDDGAFVHAICAAELNKAAQKSGVSLVSGLSTCPVLSAIGLREIVARIGAVTDVTIGIAPSPKAPLGLNVVAAVAQYAGQKRVPVFREGDLETVAGLTELRRETICVPGELPLPHLPFAVADAPDAAILPERHTALKTVWTGAGTRPVWLLQCLVFISRIVARGGLPSLGPLAGLFHWARGLFKYGDHRGGMFVRGQSTTQDASWHLIAIGDDGPMIPALPSVALVRKILHGKSVPIGSHAGDAIVTLANLAPELDRFQIRHGVHLDGSDLPPYEKILGDAFARLHPAVADLHRTGTGRRFEGQCDITRGRNPLALIPAALFGFPKTGLNVPVTVNIQPDATGEMWTRNFGGRQMQSHHSLGTGQQSRLIVERFGLIRIHMAVLEKDGQLHIETRGWSLLGIPLPRWLKPGGDVYETQDAHGRFNFHVELKAPLIGVMVKYVGWLSPIETS